MYIPQMTVAIQAFQSEFPCVDPLHVEQLASNWEQTTYAVHGVECDGPMTRVVAVQVVFKKAQMVPQSVLASAGDWKDQVHGTPGIGSTQALGVPTARRLSGPSANGTGRRKKV